MAIRGLNTEWECLRRLVRQHSSMQMQNGAVAAGSVKTGPGMWASAGISDAAFPWVIHVFLAYG